MSRATKPVVFVAVFTLVLATGIAWASKPLTEPGTGGFATGTVVHADAVSSADSRLVDVEEAFSGAAVNSGGLNTTVHNEVGRIVYPQDSAVKSYARGSGLEAGILNSPADAPNAIVLQDIATAAAPPSTDLNTAEIGPVAVDPVAYASLLRGQAQARWANDGNCFIGEDLSNGIGYAADVQLLNTGGDSQENGFFNGAVLGTDVPGTNPSPDRAVASSRSHLFVVPQVNDAGVRVGNNFGLASEVRMTIAPVTLFAGDNLLPQATIEFLGEWVLRATALGTNGGATIHYGPGDANLDTPVLRILDAAGVETRILTLQDITGPTGIQVDLPAGLASISLGEDPHKIGDFNADPDTAANGTSASAAVDVLRVQVLDSGDMHIADLRVGHMEAAAQVPEGGIECPVPVTKKPTPAGVSDAVPNFKVDITVRNPFGCDMTSVKLTDVITTKGSARFQLTSGSPAPNTPTLPTLAGQSGATVVWNNIGPIAKGASKTVTLNLATSVTTQGSGGEIDDIATAEAVLGNCSGAGEGSNVRGSSIELRVPRVAAFSPPTGVADNTFVMLGLAIMMLAGLGVRALRRSA